VGNWRGNTTRGGSLCGDSERKEMTRGGSLCGDSERKEMKFRKQPPRGGSSCGESERKEIKFRKHSTLFSPLAGHQPEQKLNQRRSQQSPGCCCDTGAHTAFEGGLLTHASRIFLHVCLVPPDEESSKTLRECGNKVMFRTQRINQSWALRSHQPERKLNQ
jgi:hypothetical protein